MGNVDLERPVDDLDIYVSEATYQALKNSGVVTEVPKGPDLSALEIDAPKIEIWKSFPGVKHSEVWRNAKTSAESQGLLVATGEDLCKWKSAQGRKKDLKDLEIMRRRLSENGKANGPPG